MNLEKTQLKLCVSSQTGHLVGYVSRHSKTNKLMGVRADSPYGKKVCVLSDHIKESDLVVNKLYAVTLKPMRSDSGFVIVRIEPLLFPAIIKANITPKKEYCISISFGNKTVFYDPIYGRTPSSKTLEGVVELLRERNDIEDCELVIKDFRSRAELMLKQMRLDGITPANK